MDGSLLPDYEWTAQVRRKMLAWYKQNARDLPWRRSADPYRIWISEVMLQQTQVDAVKVYYERFQRVFPTIQHLATASEHEVLRLWEGLGYYRRARQLHQTARLIVERHGGQMPQDPEVLLSLPGIGRYTAGAILSIAFDQRQPILEANTLRVYSRLLGYTADPRAAVGQRTLWAFAEHVLPQRRVGLFNQSMMELGSRICTPHNPLCPACPVRRLCRARETGSQNEIPLAAKRKRYKNVFEVAVVVWRKGNVLLRHCADTERWAGLWDFPRFRVECTSPNARQISEHILQITGIHIRVGEKLATIKHGVTRFRIDLDCYEAMYEAGRTRRQSGFVWTARNQLDRFPLSATGRKISVLLKDS
jgi:A/G-specific adenine glycosylase